jgi:hypothetical protein
VELVATPPLPNRTTSRVAQKPSRHRIEWGRLAKSCFSCARSLPIRKCAWVSNKGVPIRSFFGFISILVDFLSLARHLRAKKEY